MTELPDFNYPEFNETAAELRAMGYHVKNPAENSDPPGKTWDGYMRLAIAQLVTCDAVVLLPGWINSKGARLERHIAISLGMTVLSKKEMKYLQNA